MARPNPELIEALRHTARRLEQGAVYRWTHMGSCNCGQLAQTLTRLPRQEIHRLALEKAGDWSQQARDYCPDSGYPMDHILAVLLAGGLERRDLVYLERLADPRILRRLPRERRPLRHKVREDVVLYLRTWAGMLEEEWLQEAWPDSRPAATRQWPRETLREFSPEIHEVY